MHPQPAVRLAAAGASSRLLARVRVPAPLCRLSFVADMLFSQKKSLYGETTVHFLGLGAPSVTAGELYVPVLSVEVSLRLRAHRQLPSVGL